jgi:2-oxoglutarate dehydrogenase E2 component (dihydrolipoamide succinyltransferase)
MSTNVMMPQMGESIAEGTIVRWIKKVGDAIDKDEPLFEISTDKVDAEIPSPGAGVLLEIKVKEGETVPVNSVVAVIGGAGEKSAAAAAPAAGASPPPPTPSSAPDGSAAPPPEAGPSRPVAARSAGPAPAPVKAPATPKVPVATAGSSDAQTLGDLRRQRSSPLVRRIAKQHGVDITDLNGTGISGRVTKKDILAYVEGGGAKARAPQAPPAKPFEAPPAFKPGEDVRIEKMSVMRKKIAEHMVMSVHTSAHVYSTYEVDFGRVEKLRQAKKADYEAAGTKLTYTAFIAKATVDTIRQFPFSNASLDGDNVVYKREINLGIAVALDSGLIVPVIRNADERSMLGLSRAIADLANRARTKQLKPEEVQGGTFTITNPGVFGALFGLPLISQPQVAILGVGSVDKRVVVVDDMIAVRPMCYLTLGFDHRLIDGADAGRFLQALKDRLQDFDDSWV